MGGKRGNKSGPRTETNKGKGDGRIGIGMRIGILGCQEGMEDGRIAIGKGMRIGILGCQEGIWRSGEEVGMGTWELGRSEREWRWDSSQVWIKERSEERGLNHANHRDRKLG